MKNLFDTTALNEILQRIDNIRAGSQRQWGKMDVAQMLAHCVATMEMATGLKTPPRTFLGRILGPLFKSTYIGEKPFSHNSPTDKSFIVTDARDFACRTTGEKDRLLQLVKQFGEGGEAKCTRHPHAFFGKLTPHEWGNAMYKHLDHHLRQFGG